MDTTISCIVKGSFAILVGTVDVRSCCQQEFDALDIATLRRFMEGGIAILVGAVDLRPRCE